MLQSARIFELNDVNDLWTKLSSATVGQVFPLGVRSGIVTAGTSDVFDVMEQNARPDPVTGRPVRRGVQLMLHRPTDASGALQMAIAVTDLTQDTSPPDFQRELAMIDLAGVPGAPSTAPTSSKSALGLLIPFAFEGSAAKALAIVCETVSVGGDQAAQDLLAKAAADFQESTKTGESSPTPGAVASSHGIAFAAMKDKNRWRDAVGFLSANTNATICQDVALVADDPTMEQLANAIRTALPDGGADRSAAQLGWSLDEVALRMLHEKLAGGTLAPELTAVLVRHTGEVGRSAASLEAVLKGVRSREEFDARLSAENQIFLEDTSPASRVRAYDWLAARKQAPQGFDPLGPTKQRRAALEKASAPVNPPVQPATSVGGLP
jgi:hypothetical protein